MTTRLQTVANLAAFDALPESYVDSVTIDVNYLTVAGADLVAATTINPTAEFHKVTGSTTIDNIVDSLGAVAGQQVRLWFTGTPLIRNNGGGTGNIRLPVNNYQVTANEVLTLVYDGTNWRLPPAVANGWTPLPALTYGSTDGHTFTATYTGDLTDEVGVGARIKLTNQAATQYFIVTAHVAGTLTLYGGTTYSITNTAITAPLFSREKAPVGFPPSPTLWTETFSTGGGGDQVSPTQNVWYNVGSGHLDIPIGAWHVVWGGAVETAESVMFAYNRVTLSTADNTQGASSLTPEALFQAPSLTSALTYDWSYSKSFNLLVAAKIRYYVNYTTGLTTTGHLYQQQTDINAVCAYL